MKVLTSRKRSGSTYITYGKDRNAGHENSFKNQCQCN